jgi:dTMP kinase
MSTSNPPYSDHLARPHRYPGRLIVFEGIHGSGKSTQLHLVRRWLESLGFHALAIEWKSSDLVRSATRQGKKKRALTPTTFSLLHATDFAHRLHTCILPLLRAGVLVLADRYVFTAVSRDVIRGCDPAWVRKMYRFAPRPDIALYFRIASDVALDRIRNSRAQVMDFEAGLDLGLHDDPVESFRIFQGRISEEYEKLVPEFHLSAIDAARPISEQQQIVRQIISEKLQGYTGKARTA